MVPALTAGFLRSCAYARLARLSVNDRIEHTGMSHILKTFIEHEKTIRRIVAKYCPIPEDIEELTQEVFIRAFAVERKEDIRDPKAFLLKIAKNLSLSEVKKHSRTKTDYADDTLGGLDMLADKKQSLLDEELESKRKLFVLSQAVASLAPEYRSPFLMKKISNMKFSEIADELNISKQAAEKRVARALIACKHYLVKHGYDFSDLDGINISQKSNTNSKESNSANSRKTVKSLFFRSAQ